MHGFFRQKIVQTEAFKTGVSTIFTLVDQDKNGKIDRDELMIAICQLHYKLAAKLPGLTSPPSKEMVDKTLKQCDLDSSGTLSKEEFEMFATVWFQKESVSFTLRLAVTSTMSMVVLPGAASILHKTIPIVSFLPKPLFKILFGMGYKVGAIALKERAGNKRDEEDSETVTTTTTTTTT